MHRTHSIKGKKRSRDEGSEEVEVSSAPEQSLRPYLLERSTCGASLRNLLSFRSGGLNFAFESNGNDRNNYKPRANLSATFHEIEREIISRPEVVRLCGLRS